jgi:hypothetical protein
VTVWVGPLVARSCSGSIVSFVGAGEASCRLWVLGKQCVGCGCSGSSVSVCGCSGSIRSVVGVCMPPERKGCQRRGGDARLVARLAKRFFSQRCQACVVCARSSACAPHLSASLSHMLHMTCLKQAGAGPGTWGTQNLTDCDDMHRASRGSYAQFATHVTSSPGCAHKNGCNCKPHRGGGGRRGSLSPVTNVESWALRTRCREASGAGGGGRRRAALHRDPYCSGVRPPHFPGVSTASAEQLRGPVSLLCRGAF